MLKTLRLLLCSSFLFYFTDIICTLISLLFSLSQFSLRVFHTPLQGLFVIVRLWRVVGCAVCVCSSQQFPIISIVILNRAMRDREESLSLSVTEAQLHKEEIHVLPPAVLQSVCYVPLFPALLPFAMLWRWSRYKQHLFKKIVTSIIIPQSQQWKSFFFSLLAKFQM